MCVCVCATVGCVYLVCARVRAHVRLCAIAVCTQRRLRRGALRHVLESSAHLSVCRTRALRIPGADIHRLDRPTAVNPLHISALCIFFCPPPPLSNLSIPILKHQSRPLILCAKMNHLQYQWSGQSAKSIN